MDAAATDVGQLIATRGGDFYVERIGPRAGRPIVFVSAIGDDHTTWAEVVRTLAKSYDCVTFDNRGIGRSPITEGPYSVAQLADDVHGLVLSLGLADPVVAVGSSLGGAVCQEWALAHPEDVTHLVLTNTWAERDAWLSRLLDFWIDLAEGERTRELMNQWALFCFSPDFMASHPQAVAEFLASPIPDLRGLAAQVRAARNHHTLERLPGITFPTLVIGAEHDIITRPELSIRLTKALPRAELQWMSTGHMSFWEQPQEWAGLIREFLLTNAAGPTIA